MGLIKGVADFGVKAGKHIANNKKIYGTIGVVGTGTYLLGSHALNDTAAQERAKKNAELNSLSMKMRNRVY